MEKRTQKVILRIGNFNGDILCRGEELLKEKDIGGKII